MKGRDQFRISVNRAPRPDASDFGAVILRNAVLFLADESPNLVHFKTLAGQVAHGAVHHGRAAFADSNTQPHDRVPVNPGHTLNGADRIALSQCADDCNLLVELENVCHVINVIHK